MLNKLTTCMLMVCAAAFASAAAKAQSIPEVTLTRLDCGTPVLNDVGRFNDAYAYNGLKVLFTFSCYLIKHGDDYLLWDTGHAMTAGAPAPKVSIVDQLAQLKLKPEQIKYVGISHYHADHTGQVGSFPGSLTSTRTTKTTAYPALTITAGTRWHRLIASKKRRLI